MGRRIVERSNGPVTWLVVILFPAVFVVVGAVLVMTFVNYRRLGAESASWPQVTGIIEYATRDRFDRVTVTYVYSAGGRHFRTQRVAFGDRTDGRRTYTRGDRVPVYVHPQRPDVAVIEPGFRGGNYVTLAFGIVFASAGLAMGRFIVKAMFAERSA